MNADLILLSDDDEIQNSGYENDDIEIVTSNNKIGTENVSFSNENALAALNSYRNINSEIFPTIVSVQSLAGQKGVPYQQPQKILKHNGIGQHRLKKRLKYKGSVSTIESISESIEACVKKNAYPDEDVSVPVIDIDHSSNSPDNVSEEALVSNNSITQGSQTNDHGLMYQLNHKDFTEVTKETIVDQLSRNSVLFNEFILACVDLEPEPNDKVKLEAKLRNKHARARKEYVKSQEFWNILSSQMNELSEKKLWSCVKEVKEALELQKVSQHVELQATASTSSAACLNVRNNPTPNHKDGFIQVEKDYGNEQEKVDKLFKALRVLNKKIKKEDEKEVDLDDEEDSSFLRVQRYKDRFAKIYAELCKLTSLPRHAFRASKKKIRFEGTNYPAANKEIGRWLNTIDRFPDYMDVLEIFKKVDLGLSQVLLQNEARDAFAAIGKYLQKRRHRELWDILGQDLPMDADPADADPTLNSKLLENRRYYRKKEQAVIDEFVQKQLAKPEASEESDTEEDENDDYDDQSHQDISSENEENTMVGAGRNSVCDVAGDGSTLVYEQNVAVSKRVRTDIDLDEINDSNSENSPVDQDKKRCEKVLKEPYVIQLDYCTVNSNFPKDIFSENKRRALRDKSNVFKNSAATTAIFKPLSYNLKHSSKNTPVDKLAAFLLTDYRMKVRGVINDETSSSNNQNQTNSSGNTNSGNNGSKIAVDFSTPPLGGDNNGEEDDDDNKRRLPQKLDDMSQPMDEEEASDDVDEDNTAEGNEIGIGQANQPSNVTSSFLIQPISNSNDENISPTEDYPNNNVKDPKLTEKEDVNTDKKDSIKEDEKEGTIKKETNFESEDNLEKGQAVLEENTINCYEIPLTSDNSICNEKASNANIIGDDESAEASNSETMLLRQQNKRACKPEWIDNGDASESSNNSTADGSDDPDFAPTIVSPKKKDVDMEKSTVPCESGNGTRCGPTEDAKTLITEQPNHRTPANRSQLNIDDNDEIEVISENIVKRHQPVVTPQQRVNTFLENASKFAITVTRKRPMSKETKEALTHLKRLKNINISSSRTDKLSDAMVIEGESSRRASCSTVPSASPQQRRPRQPVPNINRATLGVRTPASRLPVISNVQSYRALAPIITGVRGSPSRRPMARGRATAPSRQFCPNRINSPVNRAIATRGSRMRGVRGVVSGRYRGRSVQRASSVPFVLIE